MKHLIIALILGCGLAAVQAQAACDYPVAPGNFPDGTTATKEEMLAARKLFLKYDGEMTAYIECIKAAHAESLAGLVDPTPKQTKQMERILEQKQDAALNEADEVKNRLNKEISAYVKLNPPARPAQ